MDILVQTSRLVCRFTEADAEELLRQDLKRFEDAVSALTSSLTQHEFDAIVSFAFNVGASALEHSTFARRMNRGDNTKLVL